MSPATISLIVQLVQIAIAEEPAIAEEFKTLFATANPTPADWDSLRQKVLSKTYKDYVPDSDLPPTPTTPTPPPNT
jgi:hypothetical protein